MNSDNSILKKSDSELDDSDSVPENDGIFSFTTTFTLFEAHPVSNSISTKNYFCSDDVHKNVKLTIPLQISGLNEAFAILPPI
jgi:hypothetical protein